jgi:hypothetical protein
MWFTEDINQDENTKILNILDNSSTLLPPPNTLYAIQPDGTDIRFCRLAMLGFALVIMNKGNGIGFTINSSSKHTFLLESCQFKDDDAYTVALPSNEKTQYCIYAARHHPIDEENKEKVVVMENIEFRSVFEALFSIHTYYGEVKRRTCCMHCSNNSDEEGCSGSCRWVRRAAAGQLEVEKCDDNGEEEMMIVRDDGRRYLDECEVEGKKKMEEWKKAGCLFS